MKLDNNYVYVVGEIVEEFVYNHSSFREDFYVSKIRIQRKSGAFDIIPIMVSSKIVNVRDINYGKRVSIEGQFRSYNKKLPDGTKTKLRLNIFVNDIYFLDDSVFLLDENKIEITGTIVKDPYYRRTPSERDITDILLAVDRPYDKSDYIPCIAWGRNSKYVATLDVGTSLYIRGRIQSRTYLKRVGEGEYEVRTAYEVSALEVKVMNNEEC